MAVFLVLGTVLFQDFEVPDSIAVGGEQALVVHKLPGGARTIDAMGADHRDIAWSGRFRGLIAESRAKLLDGYRIAGQPLTLTWSGYRYQVIVRSFEAQFQQPFEIPYSISCTVVSDESSPVLTGLPGIDELIGTDLTALLSGDLSLATVASSVSAVQSSISAVGTLKGASVASLATVAGTVGAAQLATQAAIAATEATMPPISGTPASIATGLVGQAAAFGQLSSLYGMGSTLARMGKNLG